MNHSDHVNLIRRAVSDTSRVWADFGSGSGAFTLALAESIGPGGIIYSIDWDRDALARQRTQMQLSYPDVSVHYHVANYTKPISLPPLDGIIMANALHFQHHKKPVVQLLRSYLKSQGHFILVEYDVDHGNQWVPYPLSYHTWASLARECGFKSTQRLATMPSRFLGQFYSSLSINL